MKRRTRRSQPATSQRLNLGSALFSDAEPTFVPEPRSARSSWVVPTRWVKWIVGVFLLPLAVIWTQAFFTIFSHETIHNGFWASEEFYHFCLGAILWLIFFFGLPRPVTLYVFGHELTHAIWVWLMGGHISEFKAGSEGGYIVTDKHNFWIALAPYFYPIYSVAVVIVYGLASLHWDMAPHTRWLFLALGITWTFHITFTLWMIPKGQSDITYHGKLFSLVVIYLMNVALLTALVILTAPHATVRGFAREFVHHGAALVEGARWVIQQWK
ncbi:MAG: hypothetical protein WCP06_10215 [Verrucomicrobiota bacterium]